MTSEFKDSRDSTKKKHSATPPSQRIFLPTPILGGHVTCRNQGLSSNGQGRQRREIF